MRLEPAPRGRSSVRGFTLIEAMVTVSMIAVLLAIAAPSLAGFLASQRVRSGSFDVYAALIYARSEAIKRHTEVCLVAPTIDWSTGWTIFQKSPTDPVCANTGTVLRTQETLNGLTVTSNVATLTYRLDGRLTSASALVVVESQTGADRAGRRCLTIDATGLPRSRTLTGSATCS